MLIRNRDYGKQQRQEATQKNNRRTPRADADCRRHTRRAGNTRISHSRLRSNSILGLNQSPSTVVEIVSATFGRCRINISTATLQPKYQNALSTVAFSWVSSTCCTFFSASRLPICLRG